MPSRNPRTPSLLNAVSADRLDRVWEATQTTPPSPELLDSLWVHASAALDQIQAERADAKPIRPLLLPIGDRGRRRRRVFAMIALGQAAALLIVAGLIQAQRLNGPLGTVEVAQSTTSNNSIAPHSAGTLIALKPIVDVDFDKTLLIRINDDSHQVVMIEQAPIVAQYTSHDFFNALEIAATP